MASNPRRRRVIPAIAVAAVMAGILLVTLDRFELPPPDIQWWEWCYMCGRRWGIDAVLNIALFVPLGLLLRTIRVPLFPALLAMVALTFVIEVLQLVIPGRITSIDDLVANSVGGLLGYVIAGKTRAIVMPGARQALVALLAAGLFAVTVLWGTLWLFEPAPTKHAFWGQFSPWLGQFAYFGGTVQEASVADQPLRNGRLPNSDAVRERLLRDSVTVRAIARGGNATDRLAPVVSIFDGEHYEIMVLGRSGKTSLTFRLRTRSSAWGLRTPTVTVWRAFPNARSENADQPVHLSGTVNGYTISASAKTDSSCVSRAIHFRPSHGWAYILPFENLITPHARRFTLVWLGLLFLPSGYYSSVAVIRVQRTLSRLAIVVWPLLLFASAFVALPAAVGLATGSAQEWLGGVAGFLAGALVGAAVMLVASLRSPRRT